MVKSLEILYRHYGDNQYYSQPVLAGELFRNGLVFACAADGEVAAFRTQGCRFVAVAGNIQYVRYPAGWPPHTSEEDRTSLPGDVRTEHFMRLAKEEWEAEYWS